jgi:hypothetical protein
MEVLGWSDRRLPMDFFTILVYTSGYLSLLFVAVCMGTHPWKSLSLLRPALTGH